MKSASKKTASDRRVDKKRKFLDIKPGHKITGDRFRALLNLLSQVRKRGEQMSGTTREPRWLWLSLLAAVIGLGASGALGAGGSYSVVAQSASGGQREIELYTGYHALVVGCGDYRGGWPRLPNPVTDARQVAAMLKNLGWTVEVLEEPDGRTLRREMNRLITGVGRQKDKAILFWFSGHGFTLEEADGTKLGYLVPVDSPLPEQNPLGFMESAVSMRQVETLSKQIRSKHVLMVFDSCFSGAIFQMVRAKPSPYIEEKVAHPVRQFITSGTEGEQVPDRSIFKEVFIQGIADGFADQNRDSYVSAEELGLYLQEKVVNYSRKAQHPQFGRINNPKLDKGDFIFVLQRPAASTPSDAPQGLPPESREIGDYGSLIQQRRAARDKWTAWQMKMAQNFQKAQSYDANALLTPAEKVQIWSEFYAAYAADNPHSNGDETMRAEARRRQSYWRQQAGSADPEAAGGAGGPKETETEGNQTRKAPERPQHIVDGRHKSEAAPRLAYAPQKVPKKITLRSRGKKMTATEIGLAMQRHDLADADLHPDGTYRGELVDNGDGTVSDKTTGLMWQQAGSPQSMQLRFARSYIEKLNREAFAGHSDWRLPTIEELASLIRTKGDQHLALADVFDKRQTRCWSADAPTGTGGVVGSTYGTQSQWVMSFETFKAVKGPWGQYASINPMGDNYVRAVRSIEP
jgi:hypothetical protein